MTTVTVSAQYELPHHIWVDYSVVGSTFDTYIGPVHARIKVPHWVQPSDPPVHPNLHGVPEKAWNTEDPWATKYAGFGTDNKTALRRIGLELSERGRPIPAWHPYPENPIHTAQQVAKIGGLTAACMTDWFTRVADWAEIVTGEDINHRHPIYDATTIGPGFEYWDGTKWQTGGFRAMTPTPVALTQVSFQAILDRVADFVEPPVELQLARDSIAAVRREDPRKAILDAATAVEVCIIRLVAATERATGKRCKGKDAGGITPRSKWLELHNPDYAPHPKLSDLTRARNKVIHAGESAALDAATDIVRTALTVVEEHGRPRDPRVRP